MGERPDTGYTDRVLQDQLDRIESKLDGLLDARDVISKLDPSVTVWRLGETASIVYWNDVSNSLPLTNRFVLIQLPTSGGVVVRGGRYKLGIWIDQDRRIVHGVTAWADMPSVEE